MKSGNFNPETLIGSLSIVGWPVQSLLTCIMAFSLIFCMVAPSLAEVSLTDKEHVLKQQIRQNRQAAVGPPLVGATGSQGLIDNSGFKWFINTNITFSTSSSASGAMNEGTYTLPVAATTANGGTEMVQLNDAFDGYNSVCISFLDTATGPCQTGNANYVMYNKNGPPTTELSGRQLVFGDQQIAELQVSRKVYIPANDAFARWLNIITNTGTSSQTFNVITSNNLGSDSNTIITGTSNGGLLPATSDTWVATMQNYSGTTSSDARLAHVLQGPGAPVPLSNIHFINGDDNPFWTYRLTLAPGKTAIIMNFAVAQPSKAAAASKAAQLVSLPTNTTDGMTLDELGEVVNFNISLVSPPSPPKGPASGKFAQILKYVTHATGESGRVMYRFDWGDGQMTGWLRTGTAKHRWLRSGSYCVKAQVRDSDMNESPWSDCTTVNIKTAGGGGGARILD